jgi:ATP-binding cassette subfamily C protein
VSVSAADAHEDPVIAPRCGADVFLAPIGADGRSGPLRPVHRFAAGELCLVSRGAPPGWQVRLAPLPDAQFASGAAGDRIPAADGAVSLATVADCWLGAMARAVRPGPQPAGACLLERSGSLALADGDICVVSGASICLEVTAGAVRLFGLAEGAFGTGQRLALHADAWLVSIGATTVRFVEDVAAGSDSDLQPLLVAMQDCLLHCLVRRWQDEDRIASRRIAERGRHARLSLDRATRVLADLLMPAPPAEDETDADALLQACRLLGARSGIRFSPLPPGLAGLSAEERLVALADAAGARRRQVALRGRWWCRSHGDMLAFTADDGQPVALLQEGQRYRAHFVATGKSQTVDDCVAAQLAPFARVLHAGLPGRPLGWRDLVHFIGQRQAANGGRLVAVAGLMALLTLLAPLAMGHVFDVVIPAADSWQLREILAALLALAVAMLSLGVYRAELLLHVQGSTDGLLQAAVWDRVLRLPVGFFRGHAAGDLAQRIGAINDIERELSGNALVSVLGGLFAFLSLAFLFYLDAPLAALAAAFAAFAVIVQATLGLLVIRRERTALALQGRLSGLVQQILSGIAKLRMAAAEARAFCRWSSLFAEARHVDIGIARLRNAAGIVIGTLSVVATAVLFQSMAGQEATSGNGVSTGRFVAFASIYAGFFAHFLTMNESLLALLKLVPQMERTRPVLETPAESLKPGRQDFRLTGSISLSHICFRYGAALPLVLDDVSLDVREGEFLAVVGPSGSGKSTLMRLLLGFEQAHSGTIHYDGVAIADLDLRAMRRQMGVVLQSGQITPGDIYANIVGSHKLTLDDAWEAARLCGLDADIAAMPMGMNTILGEGSGSLSGGQRQRLLIARAIVRKPRILLFDEATSALDNHAQDTVTRSVEQLRATRVVIAHRLSTIRNADRIVVMDQGRIVQSGRYDDLVVEAGLFRDLARRQMA